MRHALLKIDEADIAVITPFPAQEFPTVGAEKRFAGELPVKQIRLLRFVAVAFDESDQHIFYVFADTIVTQPVLQSHTLALFGVNGLLEVLILFLHHHP